MERITKKHLINELKLINEKLNPSGQLAGSFEISYAYGGCELVQIVDEGRAVRAVLGDYHRPKRELYEQMRAFNAGLNAKPNEKVWPW